MTRKKIQVSFEIVLQSRGGMSLSVASYTEQRHPHTRIVWRLFSLVVVFES